MLSNSGMKNFIVYASSPSAIDFSALAMCFFINSFKNVKYYAFIKKEAKLSTSGKNRSFESRFALPLATIQRAPDGTLCQRFIPIDHMSDKNLAKSIISMGDTYAQLVITGGSRRQGDKVLSNALALSRLVQKTYKKNDPGIIRASLASLRAIYSLLGIPVTVDAYENTFPTYETNEKLSFYFSILYDQILTKQTASGIFYKGGSIEIINQQSGDIIDRLRKFTLKGHNILHLYGDSSKIIFTKNEKKIQFFNKNKSLTASECLYRFKGPLDIVRPLAYGELAHIPWYCDVLPDGIGAIEIISPIGGISSKRSGFENYNPFRLIPSGHTLLDFPNETIRAFVEGIFSKPWSTKSMLPCSICQNDLINKFPAQKESGAKNRSGLRKYFQSEQQKVLTNRPTITIDNLNKIYSLNNSVEICCPKEKFIAYYDVLEYIADCASPQSKVLLGAKIKTKFRDLNVINNEIFYLNDIFEMLIKDIKNFVIRIVEMGLSLDKISIINEQINLIGVEILSNRKNIFCMKSMNNKNKDCIKSIKRLSKLCLDMATVVADQESLLFNSILTSNIFSLFLLLGSDYFHSSSIAMLNKRERPYINASPIFV